MKTNVDCPCKRLKCERIGDCEACREHHSTVETRYLPACDRLKKRAERQAQKRAEKKAEKLAQIKSGQEGEENTDKNKKDKL